MPEPNPEPVRILRWADIGQPAELVAGVEAVFFAAAAVKDFADQAARDAFRERWLGRYLRQDAGLVWLALDGRGEVAGYLVGCLDDPARQARFADIAYFRTFAALTRLYPAHLHVNLQSGRRGAGLGSRLVAAFSAQAAAAGAAGVHVVTGDGMRNVGFYLRNGFREVARTPWKGRDVVMLARELP